MWAICSAARLNRSLGAEWLLSSRPVWQRLNPKWEKTAELRKPLIDILNAVQWASNRRDDFAHGIVIPPSEYFRRNLLNPDEPEETQSFGCFLLPPEYKTDRTFAFRQSEHLGHPSTWLKARYSYTGSQITQFGFQFLLLKAAIQAYAKRAKRDEVGAIEIIEETKKTSIHRIRKPKPAE